MFQRRGTAAQWTTANPILGTGELGIEQDPSLVNMVRFKIGDGVTAWNDLLYYGAYDESSTGLIDGGYPTINAGDASKADVSAGIAVFIDDTVPEAPTEKIVRFGPFTAVTMTNIGSALITYLAVDSSGALLQQNTPYTNAQRRSIVPLGRAVHSNHVVINATAADAVSVRAGVNQLIDLMNAIGILNISGNVYGPNGSNLLINKTAGILFRNGSNYYVDPHDPHNTTIAQQIGLTFRYRRQNGAEGADTTGIDPNNYDVSGTLTAVPNNRYTIQRVYLFQTGNTRIQYGQQTFKDFPEAQSAIPSDAFVVESNIAENGLLRGYLIVKKGATNLSDPTQAMFINVSKFGATVGNAAAGITDANIIAAFGPQPAGYVFAGPASGGSAPPSFRPFTGAIQDPGATWTRPQGAIDPAFTTDVLRIVARAGTITGVYVMTQPAAGDCVIDIFKGSFASSPSDSSITAGAKPTITGARTYSDTTLTGWTTSVAAFDFLRFHLESSTVFTYINIILIIE